MKKIKCDDDFANLDELSNVNTLVLVECFVGDEKIIERLKEMGFHENQEVLYLGQAPFRGPKLFQVACVLIALREEEAQCVICQIL